ncbi:MAG: hypothetical protein HC880_14060 [Bacteroidia bacterium]|nr:hypothetical protein [Bacteroidia bacterium]
MKGSNLILLFFFCLGGQFVASCQNRNGGFETTESGIKYKIHEDKEGKTIAPGDFIDFHLVRKDANDSIVENTYTNQNGPYRNLPFPEDSTKGDLIEAFRLLSAGDSATFIISTDTMLAIRNRRMRSSIDQMKSQVQSQMQGVDNDSLRSQMKANMEAQIRMAEAQMEQPDPNLPKGKFLEYSVKVLAVKDQQAVQKEQEEDAKKRQLEAENLTKEQAKTIEEYAKEKKLDGKFTESGLYYAITQEGSGAEADMGDSVKVNYVGMLLNGKVFDTNDPEVAKKNDLYNPQRPYEPLNFPLGQGMVIPGWEEGIGLLKEGAKATLVIPSGLAYGPRGAGQKNEIPPNAILVFEVELVDVEKNNHLIT